MLKGSAKLKDIPSDIKRLELIKNNIILRNKVIYSIREFFYKRGFLEVETPLLISSPAPENFIDAPQCGKKFLRASPELHMKRMVAAGYDKIFQVGSCFREGEIGSKHNVEFTMLEWYESNANYQDLMFFTKDLLLFVVKNSTNSTVVKYQSSEIDFSKDYYSISVSEAFHNFAKISPKEAIKNNEFEIILTEKIEPNLPRDRPVILKDYPKEMAALSKINKRNPETAERWELYLGGIEIANAYSELIDLNEQKNRFQVAHQHRKEYKLPEYPEDNDFFEALEYGMNDFAGCALGLDRLIMILTNSLNIREVNNFTEF